MKIRAGNLENGGHRVLFAILLLMILANPFLSLSSSLHWIFRLLVILLLVAAIRALAYRARHYALALALGAAAFAMQAAALVFEEGWLEGLRHAFSFAFLFVSCAMLLRDIVLRSDAVSTDVLFGAINVYLMAGVAFALVYTLIEHLQPGSFSGIEMLAAEPGATRFLYFSFVTQTTLGYGDVTPVTPFATTVAYVEAIFGQLYIAILVAELVGRHIASAGPRAQ